MDTCTNQEHAWLQLRVDELEGRVAEFEAENRRLRGEEPTRAAEPSGDPDHEGARLIVIEMLTAGYSREQIAMYLRQTFAVEDPESLLVDVVPVAG